MAELTQDAAREALARCPVYSLDDFETAELRGRALRDVPPETLRNESGRVRVGGRHDYLKKWGGKLRRAGLRDELLERTLQLILEKKCVGTMPADEIAAIAHHFNDKEGDDEPEAAEAEAAPAARLLSGEEFMRDKAPDCIVEGLIYRASLHMLNGASKAGKTWTALQLALAIVAGMTFLGLRVTRATVLYISLELTAGMLRGRMAEIQAGTEIPVPRIGEGFHLIAPTRDYLPALDLGTQAGRDVLERLISETGAEVVFLDTLYRFLPGWDPNENKDMGEVFGALNDLAGRSGVALFVLDHMGKGMGGGPVSHSGLGASIKGGAARLIAALRRVGRDNGGTWDLDVESHFGSWDEPISYTRPRLPDGTHGGGCVRIGRAEGRGLTTERLLAVFTEHGDRDLERRPHFTSRRNLEAGLEAAGLSSGGDTSATLTALIRKDFATENPDRPAVERPILLGNGPNRSITFTWRRTV